MTQGAATPSNEAARIDCLASLNILDSDVEPAFDEITRLAAALCGVPIALISLVDTQRQWFKSNLGLPGVSETPRDTAFCAHAILSNDTLEVSDASRDTRFAANPLVTGAPGIRFYAGAPLVMPGGERLGTLCVIDRSPRQLTALQRTALQGLAGIVTTALCERKRRLVIARELAQAEDRYRLIVEGQSELVSAAQTDGTLAYVNPAYARFFGSTPARLVGRNLMDFVAVSDRHQVSEHLHRVVENGQVVTDINRMVSADGQECWVTWTNRCIASTDGRAPWIHSVGRDITEQRRAEQALVDNETRSRMMYEATPALLHSIDPQGRLMNVTDTWLRHLGYRREEVLGRASTDFLTPESAGRAKDIVMPSFFLTGRADDVEYQMVRKDGSVIDVLMSAVLERDDQGRALRSLAVSSDITDRNAAITSLNETAHMLRLVLDSLPARVSYWDVQRRNRFANKAFLEHFGVEQSRIAGRHVSKLLGERAYARIEAPIADGLDGHYRQIEVVASEPDGKAVTTDMRFIPDLRDGQVHGLFVFALDITAQRQAERESAEGERRFKLLVDGVRDYAIYMLDLEGRVATWNAGAERNKGYVAGEVIGKSYAMFFTSEDAAAGKPQHALATAEREGRYEGEGWRVRGNGTRFWAGVLLSAIRDDTGRLIGYAKITRDLTEQRRQQAVLVRAVELAPCAMVMVDPQGKITMVNEQAEATFGYARAELLSRPVEMLLPQRMRQAHPGLRGGFMANASARAMGAGGELRAVRRNGEEFPIEIGLSPIDGADGISTLAAVFDISERRRQQAATEQALAEKETLLKEVYHRVKNNLQVVQSLLNLQQHTLPAGPARDALHESVQRVRSMALVHEKLYQSGNLSAISLRAYTKDLLDQVAEAHGVHRGSIRLQADIADIETGLDTAIPYGLLLTELVTNSLKHAFVGRGSGNIRVGLTRGDAGDLLTVCDDGVGFDAQGASTRPISMGLQLADSLASQLGGKLITKSNGGAAHSVLLTRL